MRIIYGWILCVSVSFACENRVFDLTLQDFEVKIYEVLSEFANTCSFSVVYGDDEVKEHLDKNLTMVNFKQKDLEFVFDLLFSQANLHYSYANHILTLKTKDTKVFKINYVSTNRQGSSNTSVSINNEDNFSRFPNYAYVGSENSSQTPSKSGINITSEDVGIINSPFRYYTIFYEHMICF